MKYLIIFFLLVTSYASAQVPQAINYQGILRNASGQAVSMKTINVQVSITSDKTFSISKLLYSERFTVITNEFGTYAISIGYGKPVTGTFSGIDWSTGKQWIFVEVDENLNNVYEFVGSMQFSSVPYALYANTAKIADSVRNAVGIQGPKGATGAAGTNGTNGATWYTGTVVPATTTGALNDLYLNTTTGEYYKKTGANIWTMQANLTGPQGQQGLTGAAGPQGPTGAAGAAGTSGTSGNNGATWYTGSGTASSTTGVVNDLYLNIATGDYYKKTGASTWTFLANISTGIPGPQGPQGLQGPAGATGATGPQGPAGATGAQGPQGLQGVAGATGATGSQGLTGSTGAQGPQGLQGVAGPTGAAGTSGANGTNGTNGSTWYTGTIAPSTGTGVVNDFYLNTSNGDYYKKTGASTWTLQANLTGPQGATGAAGATGSQGIQGVAGPTGATGAAGSNATITMGTIAATSNVNGGTITSGVLTLTPADATNGGVLTTGVQTITGTKTYINDLIVNGLTIGRGNSNSPFNTVFGNSTFMANTTGVSNTALGYNTLKANTIGTGNTSVGDNSLIKNTTGDSNTAIGGWSLTENVSGGNNVAVGYGPLFNNTTGQRNIGIGFQTLFENISGSNNTAIGNGSLGINTTGSNNTAIGSGANVGSATLSNTTAIGSGAIVNASNSIQLGNTSVTNVKTSGTITAGAITYPNVDGPAGQVLSTTGSGTLTWTTGVSGSAGGLEMKSIKVSGPNNWYWSGGGGPPNNFITIFSYDVLFNSPFNSSNIVLVFRSNKKITYSNLTSTGVTFNAEFQCNGCSNVSQGLANNSDIIVDALFVQTGEASGNNSSNTITTHTLGESYGGGIVFFVTPDGKHGLIAAEQDQSVVSWPRVGVSWYEAPDYASNPINHNVNGNKYTDWRLPTKYELNLLFLKKDQIGNFTSGNYWSSSGYSNNSSIKWLQSFQTGNEAFNSSSPYEAQVRAVRSF